MGGLMNLFAIIVVFGLIMWVVNVYIPMLPPIKSLLNLLVVVVLVIYILQFFGVIHNILPMYHLIR